MVDEMRIRTDFLKKLLSRVVEKRLKKSFGAEVNLRLQTLDLVVDDRGAKFNVSLSGTTDVKNLEKLLKSIDLLEG